MKRKKTPLTPHFDHVLVGLAAGFASVDMSKVRPHFLGTETVFAPESFELPNFEKIIRCVCGCAHDDETWVYECLADINLVYASSISGDGVREWSLKKSFDLENFVSQSTVRHFDAEKELLFGWYTLRGRKLFGWRKRGSDLGDRIMSEQGDFLTRACEALVRRHTELQYSGGLGLTFIIRDPYFIKPAQSEAVA